MCVIVKIRCFYSFTINSQSKLKKFSKLFLRHTKKNLLRNLTRFHGGLFELEILEIFTTVFLLKTVIWTWIFFKYCRVFSLKTKKNLLKKDASNLTISWQSKRQKKNIKKRERKTRNEKKSNNNNKYFFTFNFFMRKILYFVRKHIWKKLVCIVIFLLQFFRMVGYWNCSNKSSTSI